MKKTTLITLTLTVLVGAILRLYQLGQVPHGVTHDEMGYIYNAYAIAKTGKNVFGESYPLFSYIVGSGFPFMPVTTYLHVPFDFVLPLSAFSGRLPNALLGVLSLVLIFFLAKHVFQKTSGALLSALVLAIMPWHVFFSRTAYDIPVAAFFYLAATTIFVAAAKKKIWLVVSLVSLALALGSYRGMTPIALPLVLLLSWYGRQVLRLARAQLGLFLVGSALVIGLFVFVAWSQEVKGFTAEARPQLAQVAWEIELLRRDTQGPERLKQLFINKPIYFLNTYLANYLNGYAPGHFFLYGESSQIYSMWLRGKLYLIDALLLLVGASYLLKSRQKGAVALVLGLLIIGGLPGAIAGEPYASRNFFMTVPLAILVAVGINGLLGISSLRSLIIAGLSLIYIYSLSHFLFDYYLRYAYQRAEVWVVSLKEISKIILSLPDQSQKVLIAGTAFGDALQYAFYSGTPPAAVQAAWKSRQIRPVAYTLGRVTFLETCAKAQALRQWLSGSAYGLVIVRPECLDQEKPTQVIRDFYLNPVWKIYDLSQSK